MTFKEMAQKALDVQSACNLSGVVRTFHVITESMRIEHGMDTSTCNRHPVSKLFASKIADLAGAWEANLTDTTLECERLAKEGA